MGDTLPTNPFGGPDREAPAAGPIGWFKEYVNGPTAWNFLFCLPIVCGLFFTGLCYLVVGLRMWCAGLKPVGLYCFIGALLAAAAGTTGYPNRKTVVQWAYTWNIMSVSLLLWKLTRLILVFTKFLMYIGEARVAGLFDYFFFFMLGGETQAYLRLYYDPMGGPMLVYAGYSFILYTCYRSLEWHRGVYCITKAGGTGWEGLPASYIKPKVERDPEDEFRELPDGMTGDLLADITMQQAAGVTEDAPVVGRQARKVTATKTVVTTAVRPRQLV